MIRGIERINMITGLVRALVRHRLEDFDCTLTVAEIDAKTTDADRAFVLRFCVVAAPLYPLPKPRIEPGPEYNGGDTPPI